MSDAIIVNGINFTTNETFKTNKLVIIKDDLPGWRYFEIVSHLKRMRCGAIAIYDEGECVVVWSNNPRYKVNDLIKINEFDENYEPLPDGEENISTEEPPQNKILVSHNKKYYLELKYHQKNDTGSYNVELVCKRADNNETETIKDAIIELRRITNFNEVPSDLIEAGNYEIELKTKKGGWNIFFEDTYFKIKE